MSCGANDCQMGTAYTNSTQHPSQPLIYTLLGIYTGTCQCPASSLGESSVCIAKPLLSMGRISFSYSPMKANSVSSAVQHSPYDYAVLSCVQGLV